MKRFILTISLACVALTIFDSGYSDNIDYHRVENLSDWELFTLALIDVESNGDSLAVGHTNDLGILQLTPIYVEDVNRICGEERYTLENRKSKAKSLEMFEIMQEYYNPTKDIAKGIKLHNPNAGEWYAERIYERMEQLKNKNV